MESINPNAAVERKEDDNAARLNLRKRMRKAPKVITSSRNALTVCKQTNIPIVIGVKHLEKLRLG
jgi:hypothetical protein